MDAERVTADGGESTNAEENNELQALRRRVAELERERKRSIEQHRQDLATFEREVEALVAVAEAADWVRHLAHGVGKAGGEPEPGEWEDAVSQLDATIAAAKEAGAL